MENIRIKISSIVENQVPLFVKEEYPLVTEFLTEYYNFLESTGSSLDIIQNIDKYIKVNKLSNVVQSCNLSENVSFLDRTINVTNTEGFPKKYGLILINNEIILYKTKTSTTFEQCVRGFSGITEYSSSNSEDLIFSQSQSSDHTSGDTVKNLSSLFLNEFFTKLKKQFTPGFDDRLLYSDINQNIFVKQSKDFYSSKGTEKSFEILFKILYGKDVRVILPRDYIISPSDAQYRVVRNFVVQALDGNPEELLNQTVFQDQYNKISESFGSITDVQKILVNGNYYYVLSIDYDYNKDVIVSGSTFGVLSIHPKTTIIGNIDSNSKFISVDSTIGFPDSGELILGTDLDNVITYDGKTINQFLNCNGITSDILDGEEISLNTFAFGYSNKDIQKQIKFRITGVLSDVEIPNDTKYYEVGDIATIMQLGYEGDSTIDNNWVFNTSVKCNVSNFSLVSLVTGENGTYATYNVETYDNNWIYEGDSIEIDCINLDTNVREQIIVNAKTSQNSIPKRKFQIELPIQVSNIFTVKKQVSKYNNEYTSDILNVYKDKSDNTRYVTSSSLPFYGTNVGDSVEDFKITIDNNFNGESIQIVNDGLGHGFLTGDAIVYTPEDYPNSLNINQGIYYVKRENENSIKISRSRSNIDSNKYISIQTVGIGTTVASFSANSKTIITGINTENVVSLGISVGDYVFGENLQTNTSILSIGDSNIEIDKTHTNSLGYSSEQEFSFRKRTNDIISLFSLSKSNIENLEVDSQKLVRSFSTPINGIEQYETKNGTTGLLINGVEVLNYKSEDYIYYGPIKSIDIISPGRDYDVINPPILEIKNNVATSSTAKAYCGVNGELVRIDIIDGGFDYIDTPIINITGGGGSGAVAEPKIIDYDHFVDINSSKSNGNINLSQNIIGFSTYHKFRDGESITYETNGNTVIGGLNTDSKYYVNVINDYQIKLHKTYEDSLSNVNPIIVNSYGVGTHRFKATTRKRKINSIKVINAGNAYKNEKISVNTSGISTFLNTINVYEHPFNDREVIYYYGGVENISGLTTGSYVCTKIDNKSFKLSEVGIGTTSKYFYYDTEQYINLQDSGSGEHIFGYEPIQVTISGKLGISTASNIDVSAKIQPIFRGKLSSVFVYDGGVGYGNSTIINYNKQPEFIINSGSGARITPIISNGRIVNVIINESGENYNSIPDIVINGSGIGAILTPIIYNGKLVDVIIVNKGINYDNSTKLQVVVPGTGFKLKSNPQYWTVNRFKRLLESKKITSDDSVIYRGINLNAGTQYTHLYAPRSLRKKIFTKKQEDGIFNYRSDYLNDFNEDKYHSPLLGWSYDGHPIYGPYGYNSLNDKSVRQIHSGYSDPIDNSPNRPNKEQFPAGYFIEDYQFSNSGDLDEHNGRFCITPEFPKGIYAYFMTLSEDFANDGQFKGEKTPVFPYVIGNTYKSIPVEFNFDIKSNQDEFDFTNVNIIRNTYKYNNFSKNSQYQYLPTPDEISNQNSIIDSIESGGIETVKIVSGGNNYQPGDNIVFDNTNSGGFGAYAEVRYVKGKPIVGISKSEVSIEDVEFYPSLTPGKVIGFSSQPHNLLDGELIYIDSLNDYDIILEGKHNIGIRSDNIILSLGVNDANYTGIVTYFYVSGILDYPIIRENDILKINSEDVKVLNIDKKSSRIRVLREQNSTVSTAHSAYSVLYEDPRKFTLNVSSNLKNKNYKINKEIYFNPTEALSIGVSEYTINFSNPGVGKTNITIPEKTVYIENHGLKTGDKLVYKTNGNTSITVSNNGLDIFSLKDKEILYVAKINNDLIGISTTKVGFGTNGDFVGISQTGSTLYFNGVGDGSYHSFITDFDEVSKGNVSKTRINVSTATTHSLKYGDSVFMNSLPGISTTITIQYNEYNRVLVCNPKNFSSIDTNTSLIYIKNHGYRNGEKIIYTSNSPSNELKDQGIYYVIIYDQNRFYLANSYYKSLPNSKLPINITSSSSGILYQINPKIEVIRNNELIFDVSHSSLSEIIPGVGKISSFDLDFYTDQYFSDNYFVLDSNANSKILKSGQIGVDTTAKISFTLDESFPNKIYYKLTPKTNNPIKNQIIVDNEINDNSKLVFVSSEINKEHKLVGITSNTFSFDVGRILEYISFTKDDGDFEYYTNSNTEFGEILDIYVKSEGKFYSRLPSISTVTSSIGSGAILLPQSNSIGKVNNLKIQNIGYNYPVDNTLNPYIKFPTIFEVYPLTTFEYIRIKSLGKNYSTNPDLVVIDGVTGEIVNDVFLKIDNNKNYVDIIKNSNGFYNAIPRIVPINNSNGIGIDSITYDNITKTVSLYFTSQFSNLNDIQFSIGDKIFIEGISVTNSSDKGFNSKNYNYSTFTITEVFTNLGGFGSGLKYTLDEYLTGSENPGTFDSENSSGRVILESDFPQFEIKLNKNDFIIGETLSSNGITSKILKWDNKNEYLTVSTNNTFKIGDIVLGETSKLKAVIQDIFTTTSTYNINSYSIVDVGWNRKTGFLNETLQRIQDSDYYQYFSYSLESEVSFENWNSVVSSLNHTPGFKKFSNLLLNSNSYNSGIKTDHNEGLFSATCYLNSIVDIECVYDYDLGFENYFYVENTLSSDKITFNSIILQDYSESVGNRVLTIDDISQDFSIPSSKTSVTSFSI